MSKAREWANAEQTASRLSAVLGRFEVELRTIPLDGAKEFTFSASVGRTNGEPDLCLTDYRLGGVSMPGKNAIALARWILDTFGEAP